ncbi:MAG TPA: VWA domain-containing protein [Candidatus Acidoferrum sp.]|jgi:VWFA-related protein|nr:VWA domain-containing protein [Candidatus Acidoferrum sp.]
MTATRRKIAAIACASLLLQIGAPSYAQQSQPQPPADAQAQTKPPASSIRVTSELVLANVVVRDKKGNLVRDLKKEDFTLFEDGKKQQISTFDFENVDQLETAGDAEKTVTGEAAETVEPAGVLKKSDAPVMNARDRRVIVLYFDFSAMEPDQIGRCVESAKKYINGQMRPADIVALVSLSTNMRVDLDFTDDKTKILSVLSSYSSGSGEGFAMGDTGSAEGAAETGGSFTADDTDYNTFSADWKLLALQSTMQALGKIEQKKSLIYFSNGISQTGTDNQSALRAATAAAVKNNVSIYPVDVRGLQAFPPGGEAQNASLHGQSAYNGAAVLNDLSGNAASQETLSTLAADTGGKAFFDSNDFSGVFTQVQKDSSAYYVLGFTSTNPLKDGHYRRLKVQVNRADVKLEFRPGYYAGRDYQHLNRADREAQLEDELAAELPQTDVPLYAGTAYFRQDESHYYLAVSLVVPGSQIPFVQEKDKDNATIDIIGEVRLDSKGRVPVGQLRDTVKLAVDSTQQVRRKNVQYNTGFVLAPGSYHLKFIVRENQTGRMGSFETDVQVPDLRKAPLRMSSVVLSNLRAPVTNTPKKKGTNPLIQDQTQLVPNVTHVFTRDQHLYLQYEIYDPARGKVAVAPAATPIAAAQPAGGEATKAAPQAPQSKETRESIHVLTSIEFLRGNVKVYESKQVAATEVTAPDRKAVVFQIDLPLQSLKPGLYVCQVNVIDDVAGNFAFPRWPILIKDAAPAAAPATQSSSSFGQ